MCHNGKFWKYFESLFLGGGWVWLFCNTPTLNEANLSLFVNFFPFSLIRVLVFSINHRFLHFKLDGELSCDLPKEDKKFNETCLLFLLVLCHTLLSNSKSTDFYWGGGTPSTSFWPSLTSGSRSGVLHFDFWQTSNNWIYIYFCQTTQNYIFSKLSVWHRENSE